VQYRKCRWYDVYPALAFILKLIQLMPSEQQAFVGGRLNEYLSYRAVAPARSNASAPRGNRWYDDVEILMHSLERLKSAPCPVQEQSADFLMNLFDSPERSRCA
jgi:hypothetical protein